MTPARLDSADLDSMLADLTEIKNRVNALERKISTLKQ